MLRQLATVRNSLLALACLIYSHEVGAQKKANNLYFICGHPFENIEQQYDAWLLKYDPDSAQINKTKQLSTSRQLLYFIKQYDAFGKIFVLNDDWISGKNKYLTVIDMDRGKKDTTITFTELDYYYIDSKLIKKKNSEPVITLDLANHKKQPKFVFLGIGIETLNQFQLEPSVLSSSYIIGSLGGAIQNEDEMGVYTSKKSGELKIPKTEKIEDRPSFEIVLPEKFWNQDGSLKLILLNTDDLFVFKNKESNRSNKEVGNAELLIYQKSRNEWSTLNIKGNRSNVRSFGSMIAGVVQSYDVLVEKDSKGQQKVTKFKRVSPGKEARRKEGTTTGAPVDERFFYASIYSPGILYLYNTTSKNYLEWNTGQGDSEILLVENNEVYYRVNDEIYKALVLNGKKLGKTELLVKNEMVPDIHWAFISK